MRTLLDEIIGEKEFDLEAFDEYGQFGMETEVSGSQFTLHTLKCHTTEDYFVSDDCLLKTYVDNALKKTLRRKMNDGQLWQLNLDFSFNDKLVVKLWDEDWPDPDDLIGTLRIDKNSTSGTKQLRSGRAHYTITYNVKHSSPGTTTSRSKRKCSKGEFLDAIRFYLKEREPVVEQRNILTLLCSSASFRERAEDLNGRYVTLEGGTRLDSHCGGGDWRDECEVNADGVLTRGSSTGRTVIWVTGSAWGSEFIPARAIGGWRDRQVIFIDSPSSLLSTAERRGRLIQSLAHETFHAHRYMNSKGGASKTLRESVSASIDEEIDARNFEKQVVDEIRRTTRASLLKGYVHSVVTDRFAVERDKFPGILNLTYLEQHAMSALMLRAAEKEGLTYDQIKEIDKHLTLPKLKAIFELEDAIANKSTYKDLRLLVLYMDKDWEKVGLGGAWTAIHEATAQKHACVFRQLDPYTPHPDPTIRKPTRCT